MTRILVVDDDAVALLMMRAALRQADFDVCTAENGADALHQFRSGPFDMIMLDVNMPGISGHELCSLMRAEAGQLLPILMVTGMDDVASVERAYQVGATDFIAKPINWALLGHRVKYLLRGHSTLLELRSAEARMAAILKAIPDLLFEIDIDGRYIACHSPGSSKLVAPAEYLIGKTIDETFPPNAARICMQALRIAQEKGSSTGGQFQLQLAEGVFWFELSVSRRSAELGAKSSFMVLSRDITERKSAEVRISKMAYFDSLTGLPNRQSFLERVNRETQRARKTGSQLAVLFMDLDGFKNVNDTLGHTAGDLILQWAADRLREGLRPSDALARPTAPGALEVAPKSESDRIQLARLGGDEFTALILGIERPQDALVVAHRIGQLIHRPFVLEGRDVNLSVSIGIALFPNDGHDGESLLKHADTAMYHAKGSGRDNAQFYSASLTERAMRRMELDTNMRLGMERDEFFLEYQPLLDVASGRMVGVEALVRWKPLGCTTIPPIEFIPLAEENGLIGRIGLWVLETACANAAIWNNGERPVYVAVNLSPLQFKEPGLLENVVAVLARTGLDPTLLVLEVTEGTLMEDSVATLQTLRALRALGIRIALDDFGTGYSSLSYLTRMPINHLKIDRSFVTRLLDGDENMAIVRAVLAMASSLGLQVTAEGVETIDQAIALKSMRCECLQGDYFSRPVAPQHIPALLAGQWTLVRGLTS